MSKISCFQNVSGKLLGSYSLQYLRLEIRIFSVCVSKVYQYCIQNAAAFSSLNAMLLLFRPTVGWGRNKNAETFFKVPFENNFFYLNYSHFLWLQIQRRLFSTKWKFKQSPSIFTFLEKKLRRPSMSSFCSILTFTFTRAGLVVKWSACSPYFPTIRVRIPLKSAVFTL